MRWTRFFFGVLISVHVSPSIAQFVQIDNGNREDASTIAARRAGVERAIRLVPLAADDPASGGALVRFTPHAVLVQRGQSLPGGEAGTFLPGGSYNSVTLNAHGRIAFYAQVEGSARNQGIFYAEGAQLDVIAMGCGEGGGSGSTATCGDPTPIGGTFSGMFLGTLGAPVINDNGDVLFMSDVAGGQAPRALFLYRADTQDIVKIAAIGDPSPSGGTLTAIGLGSMNNHRVIAFLAITGNGSFATDILVWEDGQLSAYVSEGDPAPGDEAFLYLGYGSAGYTDGTRIPESPVPAIDDSKQIAFGAASPSTHGYLISRDGIHQWVAKRGDPAPGGGVYEFLDGHPVMNGRGEIAFYAWFSESLDVPAEIGGWYVGALGKFRRAIAHDEVLLDGVVKGLSMSRNPFRPLDDRGNLVLKATRELADGSYRETLLVSRPDGSREILLGGLEDSVPGTEIWINGWPSMNNASEVQFGAQFSDHPVTTDGQFITVLPSVEVFSNGFEPVQE